MNFLIAHLDAFLEAAYTGARHYGIDLSRHRLDHVCWRCPTADDYLKAYRAALESGFAHLDTSPVSGRPVSIFCFPDEIYLRPERPVQLLEVTAPKPGQTFAEGYEHLAFLSPALHTLVADHPQMAWDTCQLENEVNPFVAFQTGGISVEFHVFDLQSILDAVC